MKEQLEKLIAIFKALMLRRFFGKIEVVFNAGKIVHVKKEESVKLD